MMHYIAKALREAGYVKGQGEYRYTPCHRCKELCVQADMWRQGGAGKGTRTLLCIKCAMAISLPKAKSFSSRSAQGLFADDDF